MEEFPKLKEKLRIVIFCGGYGTRMWPMSRQSFPKQFQSLLGETSFFRDAIDRVELSFKPEDIFVSVPEAQANLAKDQCPEIPTKNIITEPERRDTLGALGYVTAFMEKHFPGSLVAVIWGADHLVKEKEKFNRIVLSAASVCQEKEVVCLIEVKPTYPSTANGWVKIGKIIGKVNGFSVHEFKEFVEKPDLERAKKMFVNDSYLINTGYSVFRSSVMLKLYQKYAPECYSHLALIAEAIGKSNEREVLRLEYAKIEKTSVDYGLMEKLPSESVIVIPSEFGWYDVGTWDLLYEALARGQRENVDRGEVEFMEAHGNLVYLPKGKIASVIGVEGLIIVDTKDGLLICKRGSSGDVKKFVEFLKEKKKNEYL